jgi:hypothetical protein
MALVLKDRVLESSTSTGTGSFTLTGAQTGYQSFSAIGNGNTTYYTIQGKNPDGTLTGEWEVGVGTWSTGNTLSRDTVLSNSLGTTAKVVFSAGAKDVFVTYPSGKALLGDTSAVSSTGTGSVVLNSNPTFATNITVNGLNVGRGDGNIATNTAYGFDAIGSSTMQPTNINNVGIGYNALDLMGVGVSALTQLTQGLDYERNVYQRLVTLMYLSGTPLLPNAILPTIVVSTDDTDGYLSYDFLATGGSGIVDTTTVFTVDNSQLGGTGSGFTIQASALVSANNNTALGYNAGSTNTTGSNSIYIGSGATGTGTNEIVIGANITGLGDNKVLIGNTGTTSVNLYGTVNGSFSGSYNIPNFVTISGRGAIDVQGASGAGATNIATDSNYNNTITIGSASATSSMTFGRSINTQTVNIATGVNGINTTKTLNLGTGTNGSTSSPAPITNINIGPTSIHNGTQTLNVLTSTSNTSANIKTINIGTGGGTSSSTNINIGNSTTGGGTLTFGQSTGNQTTNIQAGATASGSTKTMNIGTGGLAGSTTNIAIGSTAGTSTTTVNGYFKPPALASAPTYVKGAVYFDTTLNKLRVGGATTWETITSI